MKLNEAFFVEYGINFELMNCQITDRNDPSSVNFVARTASNNGVVAQVKEIEDKPPQPAGVLTCAGGGSVCSTFVQTKPFYSGRDLYILTPKREMTLNDKLYYCMCIQKNAYRYSYGRQANKTLSTIDIPGTVPTWVEQTAIIPITTKVPVNRWDINTGVWKEYSLNELFDVQTGKGYPNEDARPFLGKTPFATAAKDNNSIEFFTSLSATHNGNCITINKDGNGGAGYAFYQAKDFCTNKHVLVSNSKFLINKYIALFIATVLDLDKYRYNHGRAYSLDLAKAAKIKLPTAPDGTPDFDYMEKYVKSLPYSDMI